jgi:NAD(P)-dependent dehydrogenase (short-subunit alcohol dehydrogenase family)
MTMPVEYAAIKSAVVQLTRYMARYCRGMNIRVNALSPGGIIDGQVAVFIDRYKAHCLNKGLLEAGDVVGALVFLLSDAAQFINGQNIVVDDGFTL